MTENVTALVLDWSPADSFVEHRDVLDTQGVGTRKQMARAAWPTGRDTLLRNTGGQLHAMQHGLSCNMLCLDYADHFLKN